MRSAAAPRPMVAKVAGRARRRGPRQPELGQRLARPALSLKSGPGPDRGGFAVRPAHPARTIIGRNVVAGRPTDAAAWKSVYHALVGAAAIGGRRRTDPHLAVPPWRRPTRRV